MHIDLQFASFAKKRDISPRYDNTWGSFDNSNWNSGVSRQPQRSLSKRRRLCFLWKCGTLEERLPPQGGEGHGPGGEGGDHWQWSGGGAHDACGQDQEDQAKESQQSGCLLMRNPKLNSILKVEWVCYHQRFIFRVCFRALALKLGCLRTYLSSSGRKSRWKSLRYFKLNLYL